MSRYPTSGTRGEGSRRGDDGFRGGSAIAYGAAAFTAPAAGSALAAEFGIAAPAVAPQVAFPTLGAAEAVSGAVARTALAGLAPYALRLIPGLALAYALYLAIQMLAQLYGRAGGSGAGLGPGWVEDVSKRCGSSREFTSSGLWPDCGEAYVVHREGIQPGQMEVNYWKYDSDFGFDEGLANPRVWAFGQQRWVWQGPGEWAAPVEGGPGIPYLAPLEVPLPQRLKQALAGDALARPGEELSEPPLLPYELLPSRIDNPFRSVWEQTIRGNNVLPVGHPRNVVEPGREIADAYDQALRELLNSRPGAKPLPDGTYPEWQWPETEPTVDPEGPRTAPQAPPAPSKPSPVVPYPAQPQTRPVTPQAPPHGVPEETMPGWIGQPAPPAPPVDTGTVVLEPTISVELPPGAFGPTITIGGGPPVGPHLREPPGKQEKERKNRYLTPGASLLIRRGVNPVTEANDALNCVFKALPKGTRWKLEKENWKAQRAEAKKQGVRLKPSPARNDPSGGVSVPLDALSTTIGGHEVGFKGQSISLPGLSPRKHPFVDPGGHYYKPLSPQQKAAAVYKHANSIDINSALSCIAADQVEDRIIGKFGRATQKASRKARLSVGIMTGPTF